jgi:uncharacterized FlaG/YvyC family protein
LKGARIGGQYKPFFKHLTYDFINQEVEVQTMDTEAVNSAGNPTVPPPKTESSSSSSKPKAIRNPEPKLSGDSVDLSARAKILAEVRNGENSSSNSKQTKFSVTDGNDVVIQVIDQKTQKVVKSIPSEEEIELKNAIRDGINNITE